MNDKIMSVALPRNEWGSYVRWGRWFGRLLTIALVAASCVSGLAATRIRLATLAPEGSVYHKSLLALRDEWRRISDGQVNVVIYAGGKLGGEADVVRQMGLDSVQAAMVTVVGLSEIEPDVEGLQSIPMGFRDFAEVDYVGERLQPILERKLEAKGYVVLGWSDAGWVRFFSTKPILRPSDMKPLKMFSWAGSPETVAIYRSAGFTAVGTITRDIKLAGRKESEESVKAMVSRGLQVTEPNAAIIQEWRDEAESVYPLIRGKIVQAEIFDRTLELLREYRAAQPDPAR